MNATEKRIKENINWKVTKVEAEVIHEIAKRACRLDTNGVWGDILAVTMDITACHANGCPLNLEALLKFDDSEFCHDVFGIANHINRKNGQLERCFLPRSARS